MLNFPRQSLASPLFTSILAAATSALTLLKEAPLLATLHFLRDFLGFGGETSPTSELGGRRQNDDDIRRAVREQLATQGEPLTQQVMVGMMSSFPRDCFPDASGVLLAMFQVLPSQTAEWVGRTISMLPSISLTAQEGERLMSSINQ